MKRRSRDIAIFTLSALDVLAMSTGVFVLLVVLLMPYFRKNFDAEAQLLAVQVAAAEQRAEAEDILRGATADQAAADRVRAEAERLEQAAADQQAAASSLRDEAAEGRAGAEARRIAEMEAIIDKKLIKELDLVFVVDTTSSMTRSLDELSQALSGITNVLQRLVSSLRVGFVAYRDHDLRGWVTKSLPPLPVGSRSRDIRAFADSLRQPVQGGRTPHEALYDGLQEAFALDYRSGAKTVVVVIGDAASHPPVQGATLQRTRQFVDAAPRRTVSTMFVTTPSYMRYGSGDRDFFRSLAQAGDGEFTDHEGQMIESVLLSVLVD